MKRNRNLSKIAFFTFRNTPVDQSPTTLETE